MKILYALLLITLPGKVMDRTAMNNAWDLLKRVLAVILFHISYTGDIFLTSSNSPPTAPFEL
jgi:hypothetical protein